MSDHTPTTLPLTDAELAEARRLCEAATPGPWHHATKPHPEAVRLKKEAASVYGPDCLIYSTPRDYVCLPETWERQKADARFVVAARDLVPRLLDDVARLRKENDKLATATRKLLGAYAREITARSRWAAEAEP